MALATDARAAGRGGIAIGWMLGLDVPFGGRVTGASMDPGRHARARAVSGEWHDARVYLAGPLGGAALRPARLSADARRAAPPAGNRGPAQGGLRWPTCCSCACITPAASRSARRSSSAPQTAATLPTRPAPSPPSASIRRSLRRCAGGGFEQPGQGLAPSGCGCRGLACLVEERCRPPAAPGRGGGAPIADLATRWGAAVVAITSSHPPAFRGSCFADRASTSLAALRFRSADATRPG
jgi:hypothetical protein